MKYLGDYLKQAQQYPAGTRAHSLFLLNHYRTLKKQSQEEADHHARQHQMFRRRAMSDEKYMRGAAHHEERMRDALNRVSEYSSHISRLVPDVNQKP